MFAAIDRPHPGRVMRTKTVPGKPGESTAALYSLNEARGFVIMVLSPRVFRRLQHQVISLPGLTMRNSTRVLFTATVMCLAVAGLGQASE